MDAAGAICGITSMWLDYEREVKWDLAQFNIIPWHAFDDIMLTDFPDMVWPLTLRGEQSVLMQRLWKDDELRKGGKVPDVDKRRAAREYQQQEEEDEIGVLELRRQRKIARLQQQLKQQEADNGAGVEQQG